MRSITPMRTAKIGYIAISVIICLFGTFLVLFPDFSVTAMGTLIGIFMILFGIVKLIGYFSRDLYRLAFQYDLASGILLMILGGFIWMKPVGAIHLICVILGLCIMADGLFKIQIAMDAKRFGLGAWRLILTLAAVTGVVGIMLLLHPAESTRILTMLLGISLIAEGVLNASVVITAVKIIRHQQPDVVDAEYKEM